MSVSGGLPAVGKDTIRHFLYLNGRWRWRPTKKMRAAGFYLVNLGHGGPGLDAQGRLAPSPTDMARAIELNAEWDKVRKGVVPTPKPFYPVGSVGDGYQRAVRLREAERKAKGITWTADQEKRDDWPRAWRWIEPVFGDVDPKTVRPEHFLTIDDKTGKAIGFIPLLEAKTSPTERHRVVKVWRALWKKMAAMNYCRLEGDPTLTFANNAPAPRQDIWQHREVVRLVQRAWRMGYKGLAAMMAAGWDTMLSPVDVRGLSTGQMARDEQGALFLLDRAKTGRAAAGTLTQWSESILQAYVRSLGVDLHDAAPIFRTPGTAPGPNGGRRWLPTPYTKDLAGKHFRKVRRDLFGDKEQRQLADMRRSGAVEADAGGTSDTDLSNKMANTIAASTRLRKTYNPVNVVSVRRVDEARERGRKEMREQSSSKSVTTPAARVSQRKADAAK
jgi:hypothetical protein